MAKNLIYIPYHTYIVFSIGLIVYTFTLLLINGDLFNLYSSNDFPIDEYFDFWKNMTSEQRFFLSETYYKFYLEFKPRILNIQNSNKNKKIKIESKFLISNYIRLNKQFENVPYVLVSLIPINKTNIKKKLLIASHFDGHNLTDGGTAYDDAIHTISMLGVIDAISRKENLELNTQVDFLFDGAEEFGLSGAYQYADYLKEKNITENYDYLNLESMGSSPPYGFVIKNDYGNYRIQKTLSKTRGSILLAMNLIYNSGVVSSSTDHVPFNEQNWTGGVNVFLGHASVYHTKYDKIGKKDHLKMAGSQLLDFVLKYETEDDGYNGDSVGYGIAPLCIVLPNLVFYILSPIIFVVAVVLIIIKERKNMKEFLFDLLFEFICFLIIFIIFAVIGVLVHLINPFSAAADQTFIYLGAIMGLFFFLIFQRIFKIKKWSRFRLVLDLILMMVFIKTDLALPFLTITILSTIFYFFDNKIAKYILAFFQYLIMSLFFAFSLQLVLQYSTRFNSSILGNIIIFVLFFIFSYHLSTSPLDFYDVTQENKITDLIKILFSKESDDAISTSINNEENYNIMDELVDDEEEKTSTKSARITNKYFNRKIIAVYLLFFYILFLIALLLALFLMPFPFSKTFTLTGEFRNIYTDYENSTMMFAPYANKNYPRKYIRESGYLFDEIIEDNGFNFAVKSKEPIHINNHQCEFRMPPLSKILTISKKNINGINYELIFKINIENKTCIEAVYIKFNCDNCLVKMNGFDTKGFDCQKDYFLIKVGKKEIADTYLPNINTESKFVVNTTQLNFSLLLNTKKNSKDYLKFLESFGEGSVNYGKFTPRDTLYKYDSVYNI